MTGSLLSLPLSLFLFRSLFLRRCAPSWGSLPQFAFARAGETREREKELICLL